LGRLASRGSWRDISVRLAVGLAFADASIVVLALPQIVGQFDTTISKVVWVIMAYNIAVVLGVVAFLPFANRIGARVALLAGLGLFGLASIGCGVAESLRVLVAFRGLQGLGGALLLCASLPVLAASSKPGLHPTATWAAAAALGAAIGPAAGGVLTQLFDWRAIFLAQAPAAALAAAAVWAAHVDSSHPVLEHDAPRRGSLRVGAANVALALLSAGLIGALFLVVILLIDVWQLDPLGAAGVVSAIPIATYLVERAARGRSPIDLGAAGAVLLALGLGVIALLPDRQVVWMLLALLVCGAGLGLAFPTLSAAALNASGSPTVRAGRTVAARETGLVIGLLVLTPIFVHDLEAVPKKAIPEVAGAIFGTPLPTPLKVELGARLLATYDQTPQAQLPDLGPPFSAVSAKASAPERAQLAALRTNLDSTVETKVTRSFRRSLVVSALFALLVLPVLALELAQRRRRPAGTDDAAGRSPEPEFG